MTTDPDPISVEPTQAEPDPTPPEPKKAEPAPTPAKAKQKKEEWVPKFPARGFGALTPQEYVTERLNPEMAYYNKSATSAKKNYLRRRALTVVGGALVPVLVNVHLPYIDILTTAISLMVVLFVSLETVYRYREQWTTYRTAEHNLSNEYFVFTSRSGVYAGLDEPTAFTLFVDRIEKAIEAENSSTLRVMTTVTDSKPTASGQGQG
jgi:hypothetical protein